MDHQGGAASDGRTALTWRRLPLGHVLYAWAMLTTVIYTPAHNWYALLTNMRYVLVAFLLFVLLGRWAAGPLGRWAARRELRWTPRFCWSAYCLPLSRC